MKFASSLKFYGALLPVLLLAAPTACAETRPENQTQTMAEVHKATNMTDPQNCAFQLDFSDGAEVANWRILLDGVMGGKSSGSRYAEGEHMIFKGRINTDGGGFSSMRRQIAPGEIEGAASLDMRLKTDGRAYKLTFRTDARHWGRSVSYQLDIPQTPEGEWTDVTLALDGFRTSVFGRTVRAKPFDAKDVREMGIILADGIDGPFEFGLRSLTCS